MNRNYVFADEAGCFTFKRQKGASRYFLLCTLATDDCSMAGELLSIRRDLILAGEPDRNKLHATTDSQPVRDRVFEVLCQHDFRVDVTLLEKSKAQPQTRTADHVFYQYAWYYHFKYVGPRLTHRRDKTLITAAALGSKRTRAAFKQAVNNTIQQLIPRERWEVGFMDSAQDPMLWAADYCAWAVQRYWEMGDDRSKKLLAERLHSNFDLWRNSTKHYY